MGKSWRGFECSDRECPTCGMVIDDGVEDALCVDCEDTVRNPKIAAHLHAHEVGLNDAWLDSKQESRERWFRRKAQGRKQ